MKKVSGFILLLIIISSFKSTIEISKTIPYFTFYTLEHERFTQDSFDTTRTKLILYFNSECEHCQKQGKWLSKGIDKYPIFETLEMVFVSYEEMNALKSYRDTYNFNRDNITFLQDSRLTFSDKFGVETFPSILIYSKEGKLIKAFEGEIKTAELLGFLK